MIGTWIKMPLLTLVACLWAGTIATSAPQKPIQPNNWYNYLYFKSASMMTSAKATWAKVSLALTSLYGSIAQFFGYATKPKRIKQEMLDYREKIKLAQFNHDGMLLALIDVHDPRKVTVYNTTTKQPIAIVHFMGNPPPTQVYFDTAGDEIVLVAPQQLQIWSLSNTTMPTFEWNGGPIQAVAASRDGSQLLIASGNKVVLYSNGQARAFEHAQPVQSAKFNKNGNRILTVSNGIVYLWDSNNTQKPLDTTGKFKLAEQFIDTSFSPGDDKFITIDAQGNMRLFYLSNAASTISSSIALQETDAQALQETGAQQAYFSPDGSLLVVRKNDGMLHIINYALEALRHKKGYKSRGEFVAAPEYLNHSFNKVFFGAHGNTLFTLLGTTATLWNIEEKGKLLQKIQMPQDAYVQASADGSMLVVNYKKSKNYVTELWHLHW